ncbi:hypothetical protein C7212DRAFT_279352 [Tuber magnatum]|uniref:U4/U6 snRNA-associated-splicing factor PRP24 n=1 Tax=Tuber magnatum TaxID=42249 RepID=A0A317SQC9_9PEZI|nr:hypothetical protein C7212DRAFT_279352 [Tuber magnatum]
MTGGDGDDIVAAVAVGDDIGAAYETVMEDASDGDENEVAAPVPLSEEDYTRIADLLSSITNRPYQYESHVEYISLLRRGFLAHRADPREVGPYPLIKDLRKAREDMIERFPLNETMWAEWIADEISTCGGLEERLGVMELCAKAVEEESASVKLWKTYAEYIESQYSLGRDGDSAGKGKAKKVLSEEEEITLRECFTLELVVETYRLGSLATKDNVAESHVLWNKYRDLMIMDLEANSTQVEFIRNLYAARLQTPHTTIGDTFSEFSTFITRYDNANYESVMVSTNKLYAAALSKYNERSIYEDRLAKHGQVSLAEEWNAWAEYLEWETSQPKKKLDVDMACALYERCLLCFGEQARVWEEYVFFALEKSLGPRVKALLKRATRHCPWSGTLWAQYIIALERAYRPFEEVSEIKHRATTTGMLDLGGLEEVLKVNIAWCGFLKRRAFEHDAGEDDFDMAEMGISEAVTETGKKDPEYRLQRIHINFCTLAKKIDSAREIWKELAKTQGNSYEYWLRYYHWELSHGPKDKDYAGLALKAALRRYTLDWPEKILETWKNHVEDFGNVEDVEYATVRCRKLSKEILERRAQEAQAAALQQQAMKDQQQEADTPQTDGSARASSKRRRSVAEADDSQPKKKSKAVETLASVKPTSPSPPSASSVAKRDRENTTVIVKNLPLNYPEVRIRQFFRDCGTINSLKLIVEKDGKTSTATVEFENREDVLTAQTKNLKIVDGHSIEVQVGTGSTLYVTNFPPTADEAYIKDLFKDCGEIVDIRFPSLKYNTHRRFCYVQFASSDEAQKATSLHGKQLGGKETLVAKISAPDRKHERSGAVYEGREVYIRNIDFQAHDNDVQELFQKYGTIEKVRLPPGPKKGTHKGYGFVTFSKKEEALVAVEGTNNIQLKSRTLIVSIADPNPSKQKTTNANPSIEKTADSTPGRNMDRPRQNPLGPANPATSPQQLSAPAFSDIKKKTLGIMNLSDTVNDTKIRQMFEKYGPLRKVTLRPDHQGAIVEYESVADAGKATLALDGFELAGRKIKIGGLADLMRQSPERKVAKGFLTNNGGIKGGVVAFKPSQVGTGAGGVKGQKRRAGLGFPGAVRKEGTDGKSEDTVMVDGPQAKEVPKTKSNADFKAMFLQK